MSAITTEQLINLGGKRWTKDNADRVYLSYDVVKIAFPDVSDLSKFKKAKIWLDCRSETIHADVGMVRVAFNQAGIKCSK
jgi:hypothetical protein